MTACGVNVTETYKSYCNGTISGIISYFINNNEVSKLERKYYSNIDDYMNNDLEEINVKEHTTIDKLFTTLEKFLNNYVCVGVEFHSHGDGNLHMFVLHKEKDTVYNRF